MHLSQTIRKYLGWCPNAQSWNRNVPIQLDDILNPSSRRGSFKARAINWLSLFRNQILLYAIVLSGTGFWLFAGLGAGSNPVLFIVGMMLGLPISAFVGKWYWQIFNEVLNEGPVVLRSRYNLSVSPLPVIVIMTSLLVPQFVILDLIPGASLTMTHAVFAGFIFVLFWGQFMSTWIWESNTRRQLHYDFTILELVKVEKHASC